MHTICHATLVIDEIRQTKCVLTCAWCDMKMKRGDNMASRPAARINLSLLPKSYTFFFSLFHLYHIVPSFVRDQSGYLENECVIMLRSFTHKWCVYNNISFMPFCCWSSSNETITCAQLEYFLLPYVKFCTVAYHLYNNGEAQICKIFKGVEQKNNTKIYPAWLLQDRRRKKERRSDHIRVWENADNLVQLSSLLRRFC